MQFGKWIWTKLRPEGSRVLHGGNRNPDIIFYIICRNDPAVGLFSYFNTNLGHIRYALSQGYVPVIDMKNYENIYLEDEQKGTVNAWELFFGQPGKYRYSLEEAYNSENYIISSNSPISPRPDDDMDFLTDPVAWQYWHDLYKKNIVINENIKKEADEFYNQYMKNNGKILGVCLRGTDYITLKPQNHPRQPSIGESVEALHYYMNKWRCTKIFLVTEDLEIREQIAYEFRNSVILPNAKLYSYVGQGHIGDIVDSRKNDRYLHGKEYLISIYLLGKCNCFWGGRTSGTVAMHVMSDGFEHEFFYNHGRYGNIEYMEESGVRHE